MEFSLRTFLVSSRSYCLIAIGLIGKKVAVMAAKRQFPLKLSLILLSSSRVSLAYTSSFFRMGMIFTALSNLRVRELSSASLLALKSS